MFNKIGQLAVRFMQWISSVLRNFLGTILGLIVGGAMAVSMLPAPLWFNITDLAFAYIPMALLGHWISTKFLPESA